MAVGAPDWSKIIQIRALAADGTLHDVRVDDAGRLLMTPVGLLGVEGVIDVIQTDSERLVSGTDGIDQIPLAVDENGRLIMLPYGYTGAAYVPLRVDADGFMQAIMLGDDGAALRQLLVDAAGRLLAAIQDPVTENFLGVDDAGFATVVIKGSDGVDLQTILLDDAGRLLAALQDPVTENFLAIDDDGYATMVMKGYDGAALRTLKTDVAGRMIAVFRDPTSDNYAAISDDGYLGAILRGGSDVILDLALWYRFRAQEGAVVQDSSGNGLTGAFLVGGAAGSDYEDGIAGDAAHLDGVNSYINAGNDASLNFTSGNFTVEFWLKLDNLDVGVVPFNRGRASVDGYYGYIGAAGQLIFVTCQVAVNQQTETANGAIGLDWAHVVFVRRGEQAEIYVNGVDKTVVQPAIIDPVTSVRNFLIGCDWNITSDTPGTFDEFRVYSRALSPEEVLWRYRRTHVSLDERYRPLSVDPEGRLEVSVADFTYKDQVLESASNVYPAGGGQSEQCTAVPPGKLWVITSAMAHANGTAINSIGIGIYDGVDNHIIAYESGTGAVYRAQVQGQLILKPGDRLNFAYGFGAVAYAGYWAINGYELDYPY